jgi:hypothetical protein
MPKTVCLASVLYEAQQFSESREWTIPELKEALKDRGITMLEDELVHVEIKGPEGSEAVSDAFIESFGGMADSRFGSAVDAWVPIGELINVASALSEGYFLGKAKDPNPCDVTGEGPEAVNSDSYRDGGANGSGLTVAIFDMGFEGLTPAWENGDIPSPYYWVNYTPHPLESQTIHGTGCVEAVYDHCPGATFYLYMVDSNLDMWPAIEHAIAAGVDVISMSLAWQTQGWADNTGLPCLSVINACNNGLLVFVAAGNYAQCHYQGVYNPGAGREDWHDFDVNGDETVNIEIEDGETVRFEMQWSTSGGTYDYDLFLFASDLVTVLASSTNPDNEFEDMSWTNTTGTTQTCHIAVKRFEGGITEFEIFTRYGDWQEHIVSWSSTTSPSNTSHSNVVSVGAVPWDSFPAPSGTSGIIAGYSSLGPSNSGMTLPNLSGPTNTSTFVYGGPMGGTSNATPNCAGAAVCLWSADLALHASAVRWLIHEQASLWQDWGAGGLDDTYGYGGMLLYDHAPNTLWVSRAYGNTSNNRAYPLYTVSAAEYWGVAGGRVVFIPGGNYPEPVTLTKWLKYETIEYSAILGE